METNPDSPAKTIYVLELVGDIVNTGGSTIVEVGGVSFDKATLEKLKSQKDTELLEYLGPEDDDGECCYMNTDYSERPCWVISEYPLL